MSTGTAAHPTVIHINLPEASPKRQQSYSLKETQAVCRMSNTSHFEKASDEKFGDFWKADNHGVKGAHPRFHHEHVEYMVAVINGIMTEAEALDLWVLRKSMIRDELTSRALSLATGRGNGKK